MEQHNRKSYLAAPAPKAINRDGSRDSTAMATPRDSPKPRQPPSQSQPQPTPPQPQHTQRPSQHNTPAQAKYPTPTSGEIPLNISTDGWPHGHGSNPNSARSPPVPSLSLEHLSLETNDRHRQPNGSSSSRYHNQHNANEPISAVEPQSRPFFPRSTSSHSTGNHNSSHNHNDTNRSSTRSGINTSTLPVRSAGVPPPPPPPASSSAPLRPLPALPPHGSSRGGGGPALKTPGSGGRENVV